MGEIMYPGGWCRWTSGTAAAWCCSLAAACRLNVMISMWWLSAARLRGPSWMKSAYLRGLHGALPGSSRRGIVRAIMQTVRVGAYW
jgi:hypothetical protein